MTRLPLAVAAFALLAACFQADKATSATAPNGSTAPLPKEQALAVVKVRHVGYSQIGKAMRSAKKGIDGKDPAAVRSAAGTLNALAPRAASWFPLGTSSADVVLPGGEKNEAKAEIWKQPKVFAANMRDFRLAAAAFNRIAAGSDVAAMKAAHANLAGTCKSCHERFRAD